MMNVPNLLTIARLVMIPAYMYFMYRSGTPYANQLACFFFVLASVTDFLDGYIARKYKLITNFGKVMDPIADKIMVAAAMIVLAEVGRLEAWIIVLMLFRDFVVGGLRDIAAAQGTIIAAGVWGKLKTILQMVALSLMIFYDDLVIWPLSYYSTLFSGGDISVMSGIIAIPIFGLGVVLIYLALIASIFSGVMYYLQYEKM
ncbi:MAG: CDP-diacylglycerol--glycerol-3-phosphate 3-phosphatidyltransferase, partial [Deferribacteraceae bacterium]|nr:CDP-diacylglycerol--glycerol-3-phosphate 3-phosphatidyltransferase [Deferribacteraceae bacterium]